jgi:hypothetical protein
VHGDGSVVFRFMLQELLNIEQFCQKSFNEIKLNIMGKFGHTLDIVGKPPLLLMSEILLEVNL